MKTAEETLNEKVSFRQGISLGNYTCVGIPFTDALKAMQEHASLVSEEKDRRIRELEEESEEWKKEAQRQLDEKQVFKEEAETLRNTLNDFYDTGQLHKAIDNAKQALNPPKP